MSVLYYDPGPPGDGQKVLLASTVYGQFDAGHTYSIGRSRSALSAVGIRSGHAILQGNCHVDDSRNSVAATFLDSDADALIFLDADVQWEPEHLIALCRAPADLVGGVYPFRGPRGERVNMPLRMIEGITQPDDNGMLKVAALPTGFLKITRRVFEALKPHVRTWRKGGERRYEFFVRDVCEDERYGGDVNFCLRAGAVGIPAFALPELRLGHVGTVVYRDSLGAALRRQAGSTLKWVCDRIAAGKQSMSDFTEAFDAAGNPWSAEDATLATLVSVVQKTPGDVIEAGTGVSSILMRAAGANVHAIEHDMAWGVSMMRQAHSIGLHDGIAVAEAPMNGTWYQRKEFEPWLSQTFDVGFVDGPPRGIGDRMAFFDAFGQNVRQAIVVDDADDDGYRARLDDWCGEHGWRMHLVTDRCAYLEKSS